jgi:phospholipid transport system substrate-binding protein
MQRRHLIAGLAFTPLFPGVAAALNENSARALVEQVIAEINAVISSGKSEAAMLREFESIFARYGDINIMAQYALGNDGRSASAAQKAAFREAFKGYISRKYGKRFREFIGGRIEVKSARAIKAGFEVKTTAFLQGSSPFEVTFLVSDKSGRDLFFNMFIEGVNLLLAERTEIGAMLDRRKGDLDHLTADLRTAG